MRNDAVQRKSLDELLNMKITFRDMAGGGAIKNVPIINLVKIDYTNTLGSIKHKNQKRTITLKSNTLSGYTPAAVNQVLKRDIDAFKIKPTKLPLRKQVKTRSNLK